MGEGLCSGSQCRLRPPADLLAGVSLGASIFIPATARSLDLGLDPAPLCTPTSTLPLIFLAGAFPVYTGLRQAPWEPKAPAMPLPCKAILFHFASEQRELGFCGPLRNLSCLENENEREERQDHRPGKGPGVCSALSEPLSPGGFITQVLWLQYPGMGYSANAGKY